MSLNIYKIFFRDKKTLYLSIVKIFLSIVICCSKYILLVYLFGEILVCISGVCKYKDFLIIILMNILCVVSRLLAQSIETYYVNDTLKISLEKISLKEIFCHIRKMPFDDYGEKNEFNINFIKTNLYTIVDNIASIFAHIFLLILTLIYVMEFSYLYLIVLVFPLLSVFVNKIIAKSEVKVAENESGILQTIREMKKITNDKKILTFFCNYSLSKKFIDYKSLEFNKSLSLNKKNRQVVFALYLLSSLLRVCAVFFTAVFISIYLIKHGVINIIDIVVIINACNMLAGTVSTIITKTMQNTVFLKTIGKIWGEISKYDVLKIDNNIYSIELENISYKYKDSEKTMKYNLSIKSGDKKVIIGDNGSGKSTLLKIILGYIKPCSGNIFINGKSIKDFYCLNSAVSMFEPYPLLNMTCEDYISEKSYHNIENAEYSDILNSLGLNKTTNINFGKKLSAGTAQALNLIRILYSKKEFVVLDEPTSKLNSKLAILLIKKMIDKKDIVLIATHDEKIIAIFENDNIISF